jgi:hypothetical protein
LQVRMRRDERLELLSHGGGGRRSRRRPLVATPHDSNTFSPFFFPSLHNCHDLEGYEPNFGCPKKFML